MNSAVLDGYAADAPALIARYEAIEPARLYAPVRHLLPETPARVLDIGAGTGRDAAWFSGLGHAVTAVEPVAAFRDAGLDHHGDSPMAWIDAALPALETDLLHGQVFDLVLLCAVWQHLDPDQKSQAMPRIRELLAPGGQIILSLRHGPGAVSRPVWQTRPEDVIALARTEGLQPVLNSAAASVQATNSAAGVSWTWLVFRAP